MQQSYEKKIKKNYKVYRLGHSTDSTRKLHNETPGTMANCNPVQDCINICQVEDAIRMQVLECRPESVKSIQSAQTAVPVHKLQNGSRQSPNSNRHRNKTTHSCYYCGTQNWTRKHSKVCKAKNHTSGRCGKKGHLDSLCRSAGTPLHMLEAQDYASPQPIQSQETLQDYNQSLETAQYSTTGSMQQPQDCTSL